MTTSEGQPLVDRKQDNSDEVRHAQLMERTVNVQEAKQVGTTSEHCECRRQDFRLFQAALNFANQSRGMQAASHGDKELLVGAKLSYKQNSER